MIMKVTIEATIREDGHGSGYNDWELTQAEKDYLKTDAFMNLVKDELKLRISQFSLLHPSIEDRERCPMTIWVTTHVDKMTIEKHG